MFIRYYFSAFRGLTQKLEGEIQKWHF